MNPYRILGVGENASDETVARAYKRLAKKYHPDLNPGNAAAAAKMGEINRAYSDIKAMRQQSASRSDGGPEPGKAYDPDAEARRDYTYYYRKPRMDPVMMILAAVVMFFLIRLILNVLFGGYSAPPSAPEQGNAAPDYGQYQVIP